MTITELRPVEESAAPSELTVLPTTVPAGFPSPALDFVSETINLHEHLVHDPPSTYIARVSGSSMVNAGISDGDHLLIRKGAQPRDGDVVVAVLDGQLTVKRLRLTSTGVLLQAENPEYSDIEVPELSELIIWGVAYMCLHSLR
ncbi:LexA family protein [Nesterenkonia rhizosphaerae]|uniref:Translesion error-prone DNA polymerase V autoproteolytic subunit n=1 Tax=Nesterenkonia rhizosphaerae TaxID=1348272 RepID=A0ABP9G334_9MICC